MPPSLRRPLSAHALYTTFTPFDDADWRIYFYFVAQLVGGAGLTVLLLTMLWPTRKRKCVFLSTGHCNASRCSARWLSFVLTGLGQTAQPATHFALLFVVDVDVPVSVSLVSSRSFRFELTRVTHYHLCASSLGIRMMLQILRPPNHRPASDVCGVSHERRAYDGAIHPVRRFSAIDDYSRS